MQQLETTPGIASSDRAHVNNAFVLFFGDKFMKKKIKKCKKNGVELSKLRETVLKILRESNNYQIMKGESMLEDNKINTYIFCQFFSFNENINK